MASSSENVRISLLLEMGSGSVVAKYQGNDLNVSSVATRFATEHHLTEARTSCGYFVMMKDSVVTNS